MAIKRIQVENFKSFKELDLELGNFNVIVGANAAGKSNFSQIFKFLKNIEEYDLRDATSMGGGIESLCNIGIGTEKGFRINAILGEEKFSFQIKDFQLRITESNWSFDFKPKGPQSDLKVENERLKQTFNLKPLEEDQEKLFDKLDSIEKGNMEVSSEKGGLSVIFDPPELEKFFEENFPPLFMTKVFEKEMPDDILFLRSPFSLMPPWEGFFKKIGIYDIDPNLAKNPVKITGKAELKENGENLAVILDKIVEGEDNKRKLCNLVHDLLPFVENIGAMKFAEKSLMIKLKESYYGGKDLRADLLSDGTINITAIVVALFFEGKNVIFLEEPERNIHPHLISKVVDMAKDASRNKQIILTTHSPEVVRNAGIENLLLVSRDGNGFSTITRPKDNEEVKIFLKNDLGLDEIYVQNLLG
ncbi:MAG: AAA family ATPase [Planctomycetes bacterium]|nr:AAA family ATPase [Planctomycetota bacterium]